MNNRITECRCKQPLTLLLARAGGAALALLLASCGGKGSLQTSSNGNPVGRQELAQVKLDGWSMPDLPGTVPPEPTDLREVRERLAPFSQPEEPGAREASGVVKTLPNSIVTVHHAYPTPGFFDFRVSTPFNAASPAQLMVNGNLTVSGPLSGRYVQVGLVTNAVYNYAMDPDGNPLTNDAKPEYLFNQSALMLLANDTSGNPFVAPFDYNDAPGIGTAQAVSTAAPISFSLRFTPGLPLGGQVALKIGAGAFGPDLAYKKNNWGWWADEDYSNVRLVVMAYSYNVDPTPLSVTFAGVTADDPAYNTPPATEWVHSWGGGANDAAEATGVSPDGSVYLAGGTPSFGGVNDTFLLKFDASGNLQWRKLWRLAAGVQYFRDIAFDAVGNIYCCGMTNSLGSDDCLLVKYDPAGNRLMTVTWGTPGIERANALALDPAGNIYLAGYHDPGGDVLLNKFSPTGAHLGTVTWGGAANEEAFGIAYGSDGVLHLTGFTSSFGSAGNNNIIAKLDFTTALTAGPGNRRVWSGAASDVGYDIVTGEPGKLYIAASSASFGNGMESVLLKFTEGGNNPDWQRIWGGSIDDYGVGVAWDPSTNRVYCVGAEDSFSNGTRGVFLTGYDVAGTLAVQQTWQHATQTMTGFSCKAAVTVDGGLVMGSVIPNVTNWSWVNSAGTSASIAGTLANMTGTLTNITAGFTRSNSPVGTDISAAGVLDIGGGGMDGLILKHIPGSSGLGPVPPQLVQIDATALPNAKFTVWVTTGPTPVTGALSTNTVFNASSTLLDGDQFYVTFSPDTALAPGDKLVYPARPDAAGGGSVTVTPTNLVLSPSLAPYFAVPFGTRTLQLKPNVYNRVTNDMRLGLPDAQYVVVDQTTAATAGGPYPTSTSNTDRLVLAAGTSYQLVFSPLPFSQAGSTPSGNGLPEIIYPNGWPANWMSVGFGALAEGGLNNATSMDKYFTQAGMVNTLDSDAYVRMELTPSAVANPPYSLIQQVPAPAGTLIQAGVAVSALPKNVLSVLRGYTYRAVDSATNQTANFGVLPGRQLTGNVTSLTRNFAAAPNGSLRADVISARITDDLAAPDPGQPGTVTGTAPWNLSLSFLIQYGTAPYMVELDGDYGSAWGDGPSGRTYAVGSGSFATPGLKSATVLLNRQSPGTYTFALRVTDASGLQQIFVYPVPATLVAVGWAPSLPAPDNGLTDSGWYSSAAIVNGTPAMAYYDFTGEDLVFVRALDADGANWGARVVIDANATGWLPSLAVINGNPAITYVNVVSGGDLKYVRATNANGTAWGASTPAMAAGTLGANVLSSSLVDVSNRPAVAMWAGGQAYYTRASNGNGTTWPGTATNLGTSGAYIPGPIPQVSMAVISGNPAVVWHNGGDCVYRRSSDVNGTAWSAPATADNGGGVANVGAYPRLAEVNGNPAVVSYDYTNFNLRYARASNAAGTAWAAPLTLDSPGDRGLFPSLAVINGVPAVSYWDQTNDSLLYLAATDVNGAAWGAPIVVDNDQCGDWSTLLLVNGQPGISYYTLNGGNLRFARFY